jgi:hypothetical protein
MATGVQVTGKVVQLNSGVFSLLNADALDPATSSGAANTLVTNTGAAVLFAQLTDAFVASSAALAVTKLALGAANRVLLSDGVTNQFAQVSNAFIASNAAVAVTKLALGAANTVLLSDGATNQFAQVSDAYISGVSPAKLSSLGASMGQALIYNGSAWTPGTNFSAQRVSTTGAIVAGSATAPSETSGSLVSVGDGTTGGFVSARTYSNTAADFTTITGRRSRGTEAVPLILQNGDSVSRYNFSGYDGANFIAGARVSASVDAVPALTSMPMSMAFQTMPAGGALTTRFSISSAGNCAIPVSLALGPSTTTQPATAGELRLPYGFAINVRNRTDAANFNVVSFSTIISGGSTDEMLFGDLGTLFVATRIAGSTLVAFHVGTSPVANSNQRMSISTSTMTLSLNNITWATGTASPTIGQTSATSANSTGAAMDIGSQGVGAGSSGTTAGGSLTLHAGDDASTGTASINVGGKTILRGGNAIGGVTSNTGGAVDVLPGGGATAGGVLRLLTGAGDVKVTVDDGGLGFFAHATAGQPLDMSAMTTDIAGAPGVTANDVTTAGLADPTKCNTNFLNLMTQMNKVRTALRSIGLMA